MKIENQKMKMMIYMYIHVYIYIGLPNNYIRLHDVQTTPLGGVPDVGNMLSEMGK